jgi:hypothetical protein
MWLPMLFLRHPTAVSRNSQLLPLSVNTTNTEYLIGSLILTRQLELIRKIDGMRAIDTLIGTVS